MYQPRHSDPFEALLQPVRPGCDHTTDACECSELLPLRSARCHEDPTLVAAFVMPDCGHLECSPGAVIVWGAN